MHSRLLGFIFSVALVFALPSVAAIDAYEFRSEADEKRFQDLTAELRCPKCQNQNIADSDAPIAKDLRREVYRLIDEGQGDEAVIDFMVTRYGDFVLYNPKKTSMTWFLWYGPYVALGLGFAAILLIVRYRKKNQTVKAVEKPTVTLSSEEQQRLNKLLNRD